MVGGTVIALGSSAPALAARQEAGHRAPTPPSTVVARTDLSSTDPQPAVPGRSGGTPNASDRGPQERAGRGGGPDTARPGSTPPVREGRSPAKRPAGRRTTPTTGSDVSGPPPLPASLAPGPAAGGAEGPSSVSLSSGGAALRSGSFPGVGVERVGLGLGDRMAALVGSAATDLAVGDRRLAASRSVADHGDDSASQLTLMLLGAAMAGLVTRRRPSGRGRASHSCPRPGHFPTLREIFLAITRGVAHHVLLAVANRRSRKRNGDH